MYIAFNKKQDSTSIQDCVFDWPDITATHLTIWPILKSKGILQLVALIILLYALVWKINLHLRVTLSSIRPPKYLSLVCSSPQPLNGWFCLGSVELVGTQFSFCWFALVFYKKKQGSIIQKSRPLSNIAKDYLLYISSFEQVWKICWGHLSVLKMAGLFAQGTLDANQSKLWATPVKVSRTLINDITKFVSSFVYFLTASFCLSDKFAAAELMTEV